MSCARAMAAQSSYSGRQVDHPAVPDLELDPDQIPSESGPPPSADRRRPGVTCVWRTPSVVDCWISKPVSSSTALGRASALTMIAGRPFFMPIAVVQASSAPAAKSRSTRISTNCGFMSSMLVSSTTSGFAFGRSRFSLADHDPADICPWQLLRAEPGADGLDRHRGPLEAGKRAKDCRRGRRQQLAGPGLAWARRRNRRAGVGQQPGGCRSRDRELTVRGLDRAAAEPERPARDALDAEQPEPDHRADDIDDRVERADLVEVDIVDRDAMDRCLGLGQPREDPKRVIPAHPVRDSRARSGRGYRAKNGHGNPVPAARSPGCR